MKAICKGHEVIEEEREWTQLLKTLQCFAENTPQVILQMNVTIVTFDPASNGKS